MKREEKKKLELQLADNQKKIEAYLKASSQHKKPISRRDFLRVGILNSLSYVAAPSLFSLLGKLGVAEAAECISTVNPNISPFIAVNMSGGWTLAGNWMPYTTNNAPINSYQTLGSGGTLVPTPVTAFANNARFYPTSNTVGFLAGLKSTAGTAINNTVFIGVPSISRDDTDNNRMDVSGLVARAGMVGSALPFLGTSRSRTGINQYAALGVNPPPPVTVTSVDSIIRSVNFANSSLAGLNAAQQQSLTKTISRLSEKQILSLASISGGKELGDLITCATGKNVTNAQNNIGAAVDPRLNANYISAWQNADLTHAAVVFNVLQGFAGSGGISMGGYDYHGGLDPGEGVNTFQQRRDRQNSADLRAGALVGRVLRSAQILNKKVFISLLSDGSVSANSDNGNNFTAFTGDSGDRGCLGILAFNPSAVPQVSSQQIGGFINGGTVDRTVPSGSDIENASVAIFANWAKFSGDMGLFSKALPNSTRFDVNFLNQVVKI